MKTQCLQCQSMPLTHSFYILEENDTEAIFYSGEHHVPHVDRKVDTTIKHIRGELEYFSKRAPHKTWRLILDAKDQEFRWDSIELTMEMIQVVTDYKSTFKGLRITQLEESMISMIEYCKPFVPSEWMEMIHLG